jgi:hypothetical protein
LKKSRQWRQHDINFWKQFGITLDILKKYNVEPISHIFINDLIITADKHAYCFIEYKDGQETYKIYQPYNKDYKWLNNHNSSVWQGWEQLPQSGEQLIITKSLKDVMSLNSVFGVPSVSLQAEGLRPKKHVMRELHLRFKEIYILYDNDFDKKQNWGQNFAKELAEEFNLINLCIPSVFKSKDFSDLVMNLDSFELSGLDSIDNLNKNLTKEEKIKLIWQCYIHLPY